MKKMKVPKHVVELVDCLRERVRSKARLSEAMQRLFSKPINKKQIKLLLTDLTSASPDGHVWTPEDVADYRRFGVMHKANPEQIENVFALLAIEALVEGRKKTVANPAQAVEATFREFLAALREPAAN
jgi:hypothetical protein